LLFLLLGSGLRKTAFITAVLKVKPVDDFNAKPASIPTK
jgi:hypothetical protein